MPIDEQSLDTNGATATLAGVAAGKVWIAIAYDEKGGFGGAAPPFRFTGHPLHGERRTRHGHPGT